MAKLRVDKIAAVGVSTENTGSVFFDGTGDYLSVQSSTDFDFGTGDFTIELYANLGNLTSRNIFSRNDSKILFKELALFKMIGNSKKQEKVKKICKKYNVVVLDKSKKSFVVQVTALRIEIDKLIDSLKPLGLVSISRTGAVAMTRGPEIFK